MPFMQRLTWDGIALHGGQVPGRPVSHGCIRIPEAFAQILYHETKKGGVVIVSPDWHGTAGTYAVAWDADPAQLRMRSEEQTSELQSLMRISFAVLCLKKKN